MFRKARSFDRKGLAGLSSGISLLDFAEFVADQPQIDRDQHWADQHLLNCADMLISVAIIPLEEIASKLPAAWKMFIGDTFPDIDHVLHNRSRRADFQLDRATTDIIYEIYQQDFEFSATNVILDRRCSATTAYYTSSLLGKFIA